MNQRVQVVLDLYVEVDVEEFNVEMDREEGSSVPWSDLRDEIVEQIEEASCPVCGDFFSKRSSVVKDAQETRGHAGPFCSRKCAGIYSQS